MGVARQYCGILGKQDNCQVAVGVSLSCEMVRLPVAWRLYLSKEWADDDRPRAKAGVPDDIGLATKTQIALEQLEHLLAEGAPPTLRAGLCRLRGQQRIPSATARPGAVLRRGHCLRGGGLATGRRAAAAEAVLRLRPPASHAATYARPSAAQREGADAHAASRRVSANRLARGDHRNAAWALCCGARTPCRRQDRPRSLA